MKKVELAVNGMHCASCEVLIERKLAKVPGIRKVKVSGAKETAEIDYEGNVQLEDLQKALEADGYKIHPKEDSSNVPPAIQKTITSKRRWAEIGAVAIIIFGLYLLFKQLDFLPSVGITDNMSYGVIFLIGLVAATSTCLAVSGGLLLAIAAKYNEANPTLSGWQKFTPHIYFNIGRIVSYTILGGLIGILGSMLTLSPKITGILTITASVLMVLVGIQMLQIFPWANRFTLKMPKFIAHKIHDAGQHPQKRGVYAFFFGGSTFFLPCGFTQALQLYVLSKGSFTVGAMTMLAFSLGTLPSLVGIGAFSSFARGNLKRHFITFSAVLVIILGVFNLPNGLTLAGATIAGPDNSPMQDAPQLKNAQLVDGKQVIELKVDYLDYYPSSFTVLQGVPVEWRIDGRTAAGCAQVISAPKLGVTEYLPRNQVKVIQFTPKDVGQIKFSCSMGMAGPGFINVVANPKGGAALASGATTFEPAAGQQIIPSTAVQKLTMEVSRERGFYPNSFTVQKGVPVELEIDDQVKLGGCMSTMVIPEYGVAHLIKLGKSVLKFTPTTSGVVPFTCAMGSRLGQFIVT